MSEASGDLHPSSGRGETSTAPVGESGFGKGGSLRRATARPARMFRRTGDRRKGGRCGAFGMLPETVRRIWRIGPSYGRRGPSGQYDQEASIHDLISACLMLPLGCLCSCRASIVLPSFLGRGFGGSSMTDHSWERYIRDSDIHSHRYVCVVPSVCSLLRAVLSSDIAVRCGKGTAGIPSPSR